VKNLRIVTMPGDINDRRPPGYLSVFCSPTWRWLKRCGWVFLAGIMTGLTIAGYVAGLLP
jgi:hypothetical protein